MSVPPVPSWLRWLLLGSLLLNIMLGVAVLRPMLAWHLAGGPPHREHGGGPDPRALFGALSRMRTAEIESLLEKHRPAIRESWVALREQRRLLREALQQPDSREADLAAAFTALRHQEDQVAERVHALLSEALAGMSAEERDRFAKQMLQRHRGHR